MGSRGLSYSAFLYFYLSVCFWIPANSFAQSCEVNWIHRPRILPSDLKLACAVSAKRRLITINRRGAKRTFDRTEALKFASARRPAALIRARHSQLNRRCISINPACLNTARFSAGPRCPAQFTEPVQFPTGLNEVSASRAFLDLGAVGINEHKVSSIILRTQSGSPRILNIEKSGDPDFELLSFEQVSRNGGETCDNMVGSYCSLQLRLNASEPSSKSGEATVTYCDTGRADSAPKAINIPLSATVNNFSIKAGDAFSTIDLYALAAQQNISPLEYLQNELEAIKPNRWRMRDVALFDQYSSVGTSDWSNNWANSALDFSGIAWDVPTAGTAITRCHIVFASHYPRNDEKPIKFHRKDGTQFRSVVTRIKRLVGGSDIGVGRLDPCLPPDWTVYPLVSLGDAMTHSELKNSPIILTHHRLQTGEKRISIDRVTGLGNQKVFIWQNTLLPEFLFQIGVIGDSGNPGFFIINGELALAMTFSSSTTGPGYYSSALQQALAQTIAELD